MGKHFKFLHSTDDFSYEENSAFDWRLLLQENIEVVVLLDAPNKFKEKKSVRKHTACGNGDSAAFERAHSLFFCFDKTVCNQIFSESGERFDFLTIARRIKPFGRLIDFLTNSKRLKFVGKRFKVLRSPDDCFYKEISAFDRWVILWGIFEVVVLLDAPNKFKEKKSVRKHSACGNGDSAAFERTHSLFSCFDKTACNQIFSESGERFNFLTIARRLKPFGERFDFLTNSKRLKSVGKRFKVLHSTDDCFYKEISAFDRRSPIQGIFEVVVYWTHLTNSKRKNQSASIPIVKTSIAPLLSARIASSLISIRTPEIRIFPRAANVLISLQIQRD